MVESYGDTVTVLIVVMVEQDVPNLVDEGVLEVLHGPYHGDPQSKKARLPVH